MTLRVLHLLFVGFTFLVAYLQYTSESSNIASTRFYTQTPAAPSNEHNSQWTIFPYEQPSKNQSLNELYLVESQETQPRQHESTSENLASMSVSDRSTIDKEGSKTTKVNDHYGKPGCEYHELLPELNDYRAPKEFRSKNGVLVAELDVKYAEHTIAGCQTHLRSYNGELVGPTLRVKPGDTLKITMKNSLPPCQGSTAELCSSAHSHNHGSELLLNDDDTASMNTPHNFNVTNLHTHGLHVSPSGKSDNVFVEIKPNKKFQYEIHIPYDHPSGTFWYHAHVHGSTALQVSSGMAGTILIEGGLDNAPEIKGRKDVLFVMQQMSYDCAGQIEHYGSGADKGQECFVNVDGEKTSVNLFSPGAWQLSKRRTLINGQVVPKITMAPGEVQRWRFVHAGVRESIHLSVTKNNGNPFGTLHQIAIDGLATGRIDSWDHKSLSSDSLEPGYRSDYLFKAPKEAGTYWIVDKETQASRSLLGVKELESRLIQVVVQGKPVHQSLPLSENLKRYKAHKDFTSNEMVKMDKGNTQNMMFYLGKDIRPKIKPSDDVLYDCTSNIDPKGEGDKTLYTVDGDPYGQSPTRTLKLNTQQRWNLCTRGLANAHPFHIHVNPFQVSRKGPDGKEQWIWRDTLMVNKLNSNDQLSFTKIYTRYTVFDGEFVLHCHILDHEDQGMMQKVKIIKN